MSDQQQFNDQNQNQPQDYESWVNSLGNIQDGVFQNTPITNHIIQQQLTSNSLPFQAPNQPINFIGGTPTMQHQGNNGVTGNTPDLNLDFFFNSPDRFYRDIINESPIVNKTPHAMQVNGGRGTPLKNLNMNFSTPIFLRNIETAGLNSSIKSFTPLKNQFFNTNNSFTNSSSQNLELFQTPNDKTRNSTLNSSPTTIKMNSSAIKEDQHKSLDDKVVNGRKNPPASPTPPSKVQQLSTVRNSTVPKMGFFKKDSPVIEKKPLKIPKQPIITTHELVNHNRNNTTNNKNNNKNNSNSNTKFQIIMTDVNSFTSSQSKTKRRKKLTRSATQVGANVTSGSSSAHLKLNNVTKKQPLKRSASQPASVLDKLNDLNPQNPISSTSETSVSLKQDIPIRRDSTSEKQQQQYPGQNRQRKDRTQSNSLQEQSLHQRNIPQKQQQHQDNLKQFHQLTNVNGQSFIQVQDLFDEREVPDQGNINW